MEDKPTELFRIECRTIRSPHWVSWSKRLCAYAEELERKLENAEVAQSNAEIVANALGEVLHRISIRATRHKRATDEREYLISDLENIEKMTGRGEE